MEPIFMATVTINCLYCFHKAYMGILISFVEAVKTLKDTHLTCGSSEDSERFHVSHNYTCHHMI